jgi:hypothetical protein
MGHRPLRDPSDLNYQIDHNRRRIEMLERRFKNDQLPTAVLYLNHDDYSTVNQNHAYDQAYAFYTNDEEVFHWNDPTQEFGLFDNEGNGENPYISCLRTGTFNISHVHAMEFAEDILTVTPWILRVGWANFDDGAHHDFFWTAEYRDTMIANLEFLGSGPFPFDDPPWTYYMWGEIDNKMVSCDWELSQEDQMIFWPTVRAIPLMAGTLADSERFLSSGGIFVVQWLSELAVPCGE